MNKIVKKYYCLTLFVLSFISLKSQDFHFSQYDLSPLYVNPALTGFMTAPHRVAVKYRSQWASVLQSDHFKTSLISYEKKTCPREGVTFAFGINLIHDEVGVPTFNTNQFLGSFAFHIPLKNNLVVAGGFQGGLLQYQVDFDNLDFSNQFDGEVGFDQTLSSRDFFNNETNGTINLLDVNGGVFLYKTLGREIVMPWNVGIAFHHVNPYSYYNFSSQGAQNKVKVRWIIHGALPFKIGRHYLTIKQMSVIQLPHWQLNIGSDFRFQISRSSTNTMFNYFKIGAGLRMSNHFQNTLVTDAVLVSAKTDIAQGFILGIGYDINVSPLKLASYGNGAVELSILCEFPLKRKCGVECPDTNSSGFGQGKWRDY